MPVRWLLWALLVVAAAPAPAAPPRLVLFGDSLVDAGNVHAATRLLGMNPAFPPSTPPYRRYWEGRFSNGPTAADYLSLRVCGAFSTPSLAVLDRVLQTCAVNFGFGGATAGYWTQTPGSALGPGFRAQVELFAAATGGAAPADALYVVWVGADDYLHVAPTPAPRAVAGHMKAGIESLYRMGARRFLVLDLPDLGRLPMSAETASAARLTQLTETHNRLLAAAVGELQAAHPGIDVRLVRASALAKTLGVQPQAGPAAGCLERFLRFASACTSVDESLFYSERGFPAPAGAFFWDELHPTTRAHRRVFEAMERTVPDWLP